MYFIIRTAVTNREEKKKPCRANEMECVMSEFTIIMLQQQQQQWTECVNILTVALLFNGLDTTFNMKSDDFDGNFVRHS